MSMEQIGGWALATYGQDFLKFTTEIIARKAKDEKEKNEKLQALERRWQDFNWGASAERYKEHMQELYGWIRIIGSTEPTPIGEIFTDVNMLNKPQASRYYDPTQLQQLQNEPERLRDGERKRGLDIVVEDRGHRLYILGKPGAGKTTFLKYLVQQTIAADELNKLPIFVTLREWDARETDILDFITKQFDICNFPDAQPFIEYLLAQGRAIVLFDGLDEVPQEGEQRAKTIQALHDFSKKYRKTQIIITCRVAASDYSFSEFTYVEMADFIPQQVKAYARNWFHENPDTAEKFLQELDQAENKGVLDLGRSPLLLSMICLAYQETLTIPRRRVELYEDALDALLKKWDSSRKIRRDKGYKNLSLGRKKQMFARIAAEYFDNGEIFFKKKEVAQKIEDYMRSLPPDDQQDEPDGEAILETISAQHGILVERAKGLYAFSHLTFQEYYTAKYTADNALHGTLAKLSDHFDAPRWREVFLLT
ncbi:MAG TPA: NACHT domain-containing protein, partial [Anaerolineales bacterium]|nr:NACHT domain-containing protein [Anaerolineales bacterium]